MFPHLDLNYWLISLNLRSGTNHLLLFLSYKVTIIKFVLLHIKRGQTRSQKYLIIKWYKNVSCYCQEAALVGFIIAFILLLILIFI